MRFVLILMTLLLAVPGARADGRTILVFGDSLSAGYGIRPDAAWPALLQARLAEKHLDYSVANASISGETTAGGRSRLAGALARFQPAVVVLALGANDGLRGLPLAQIEDNLGAMVETARGSGAKVLVVGMRLPPNYGPYAQQFQGMFREVARSRQASLVDFLLAGIADRPELFQLDQLHPTAQAQPRLLENVWSGLSPLLK